MTEIEKLKEEADKQRTIQRHEALHAYIKKLNAQLEAQSKDVSDSMKLGIVSIVIVFSVMLSSFFVSGALMLGAMFGAVALNWILLSRTQRFIHKAQRTMSELDGCFNTLEILGFLERGHRSTKKKKESMLERVWATAKSIKIWKPYGQPATT